MKKKLITILAAVGVVFGGIFVTPTIAHAGGSDSPTPYTVTSTGVQLPVGDSFQANGHINWSTTKSSTNGIHFDPNNGHPGGAYIGKTFFPISLDPGECITWVQISNYNEHFGEGGQDPVCAPAEVPEKPQDIAGDEQRTSDPVCVVPADGTEVSYLENRIWTQKWVWDESSLEWVLEKRVYGEWELSDTIVNDNEECEPEKEEPPVVPEDPKTPVDTPTTPVKVETASNELAVTGSNSSIGIFTGIGLLVAGIAAFGVKLLRKRVNV